jgi:hypothetical protein
MNEYTYSVIRYRHDPSVGEMLNVGVALYSRETGQVGLMYDWRYKRLSEAFAGFDGEHYRRVMQRFEAGLVSIGNRLQGNLFELLERERYKDIVAVARTVWPDQGLSYQVGPSLTGLSDDLDAELEDLFDRFVLSQYEKEERRHRRDDKAVWDEFKKALSPRGITKVLQPVKLGKNEVEFRYAFKNERWHVLEPISLDYIDPYEIKKRAFHTLGEAYALKDEEELGAYYVLLGRPHDEQGLKRYAQALQLLSDMPVRHRIIEDVDAEAFAIELHREMVSHGLLTSDGHSESADESD